MHHERKKIMRSRGREYGGARRKCGFGNLWGQARTDSRSDGEIEDFALTTCRGLFPRARTAALRRDRSAIAGPESGVVGARAKLPAVRGSLCCFSHAKGLRVTTRYSASSVGCPSMNEKERTKGFLEMGHDDNKK